MGFIKRITKRDGEAMQHLGHVGVMSREQAHELGLNDRRLTRLIQDGYIRETDGHAFGRNITCLKLDRKGRDFVQSYGIEQLYRSNRSQLEHDLTLGQARIEFIREHEGEEIQWFNEHQQQAHWEELTGGAPRVGTVDAIVVINENVIAIEVVTDNYGREDIQLKEEVCQHLSVDQVVIIET